MTMGILGNIFGKQEQAVKGPEQPFSISTELVPYRLYARKGSSLTMRVKVRNLTKRPVLTSVVIESPNKLGFDETLIKKMAELKLGELAPDEAKETSVNLYSNTGSDKGEYTLKLTTNAHFRDYTHVENAMTKRVSVEVV